jgi:hypothetical protein
VGGFYRSISAGVSLNAEYTPKPNWVEGDESLDSGYYPARPGLGVVVGQYFEGPDGRLTRQVQYGVFTRETGPSGGYRLRQATRDEIASIRGTMRTDAEQLTRQVLFAGTASLVLSLADVPAALRARLPLPAKAGAAATRRAVLGTAGEGESAGKWTTPMATELDTEGLPPEKFLRRLDEERAEFSPHSKGLPRQASIAKLRATRALPGSKGIIVTGKVVFGDLFRLSKAWGVEFALVKETAGGKPVMKLYSGDKGGCTIPDEGDLIAHTHLNGYTGPSPEDIAILNAQYELARKKNPKAKPPASYVIWGPGPNDFSEFKPSIL